MSEESGLTRRGLIGSGAAALLAGRADAQGVAERLPSRNGYARVTLDANDPLEAMERGARERSLNRWHQRLILLAEDANPQQATAILTNWAEKNALSNTYMDSSNQLSMHLQQAKLIAGAAMVYLRTKQAASPQQQRTIEGWLSARATEIRDFFDRQGASHAYNQRNHRTWAGLAAAATGMALGARDNGLYAWGRASGQQAIDRIQANGAISREEQRPWEALNPLFALAHLSTIKGDSLYAGANAARLEATANWGINILKPAVAEDRIQVRPGEQRQGTVQRDNLRPHDHTLPFVGIYLHHVQSRVAPASPETRVAAESLLQGFGYRAATLGTARRAGGQREEVPVLSHLGGAVTDILSIGQGRSL